MGYLSPNYGHLIQEMMIKPWNSGVSPKLFRGTSAALKGFHRFHRFHVLKNSGNSDANIANAATPKLRSFEGAVHYTLPCCPVKLWIGVWRIWGWAPQRISQDLPEVFGREDVGFGLTSLNQSSNRLWSFHLFFCRRFPEGCCFNIFTGNLKFNIFNMQHMQPVSHIEMRRGWGRWTFSRTSRCGCGRSIQIPWSDTTSVASAPTELFGLSVPMVAAADVAGVSDGWLLAVYLTKGAIT